MELKKINLFFRKAAEFQVKFRWFILVLLAGLTAFALVGTKRMNMGSNSQDWFTEENTLQRKIDEFEELFGNNDSIGILVEAPDVFDPVVLQAIHDLGEELLYNVPYADEITSLTELELSVGTEGGMAVINPFGDGIPSDPAELKKARDFILSRKSVVDKLVSSDGTETWINLSLLGYPDEEDWPIPGKDPMFEIGEAAISIMAQERWQSDAFSFKAAGMPYTETESRDFMAREAAIRLLTGFTVMAILLIVFLRSLQGVIVPMVTSALGLIVVFGFMGWFNIPIDSMMMTFPLMLGMALSVGYSVHLVNAFKKLYSAGHSRREAVAGAVEKTGWPILFTVFTTMGSMASFAFVGIVPMRWLGFTSAALVLTIYLYVIILIPILFSFGQEYRKERKAGKVEINEKGERFFLKAGERILAVPRLVLIVFAALALISLPGIMKITTDIDIFKFMGLKVPYIQRVYQIANSKLGSYLTYNIEVKFDESGRVKDPEVLKNFDQLLAECGQFPLTKRSPSGVSKIFSILDILKDINQSLHEDDPEYYRIPGSRDMVAQMLFLYEMSGGTKTWEWVDEDFSILRAQVEMPSFNTRISRELEQIRAMGAELFPGAEVVIVGMAVQFAEMNRYLVFAELKSFLIALVVIAILLAMVFTSVKTGLIGLIPNITPVFILGGVMGYFDFPMDMMTMIIMPMLLGIAVDDTIHFINQIKYEFEITGNYREAALRAFSSVGLTLAMTTVILSFSFAAYGTSSVQAMRSTGILGPLGLLSALIADYTMTPVIILLTKPFGGEKNENGKLIPISVVPASENL